MTMGGTRRTGPRSAPDAAGGEALLRSEQDAEETAQDARLRAWRGRGRQRRAGAELWWVRRIARNEALRRLARQARRRDLYAEA